MRDLKPRYRGEWAVLTLFLVISGALLVGALRVPDSPSRVELLVQSLGQLRRGGLR